MPQAPRTKAVQGLCEDEEVQLASHRWPGRSLDLVCQNGFRSKLTNLPICSASARKVTARHNNAQSLTMLLTTNIRLCSGDSQTVHPLLAPQGRSNDRVQDGGQFVTNWFTTRAQKMQHSERQTRLYSQWQSLSAPMVHVYGPP